MANPGFVSNAVQVRVLWADTVGVFLNVLHMQYTPAGPLNPAIAETMYAALAANGGTTAWLSQLPTTVSLTGVDVRDLRAPNNPLIASSGDSVPGTAVGAAMPPQVSMVMTLRTAFAGRSFRGRVFFGGLGVITGDVNGRIADGANTAAGAFGGALGAMFAAGGGQWAILQRYLPPRSDVHGNPLPERMPSIVPVTSVQLRDRIFDTQRRRTGAHIGSR